jgi:hypothetical protein
MVIECYYCRTRVDGRISGSLFVPGIDPNKSPELLEAGRAPWEERVTLLQCPVCNGAIVAEQGLVETDADGEPVWTIPGRCWPGADKNLEVAIPLPIRSSLEEAQKCLASGAFTASVVMSGRSIEAMCRHFKTKNITLFDGLKELHDRKIIDARLYEWGDELRKHRNLAAHPSDAKFSATDARDLYDFSTAICDYVFVLTEKFESFKKRQAKQEAAKV